MKAQLNDYAPAASMVNRKWTSCLLASEGEPVVCKQKTNKQTHTLFISNNTSRPWDFKLPFQDQMTAAGVASLMNYGRDYQDMIDPEIISFRWIIVEKQAFNIAYDPDHL